MHCQFEEFFIIGSQRPPVLFHLLTVCVECIRIVILRITFIELLPFFPGQFNQFRRQRAGKGSGTSQQHIPGVGINHCKSLLAVNQRDDIHKSHILHILAEGCDQRRITHHRPYMPHLPEEFYHQFILGHLRLVPGFQGGIDSLVYSLQVCHHAPHHSAGEA